MARDLKVCFGFAGLQGKRIVAFSLKARTAEGVAEFLDTCAETAVALYPVSQNTSLEQTISRMQHEVHRQKKSLQRAIDKKENNKKDDGELESKLQADVERAQKWYDYMKLKLEEVEKLRNTVPYKIQVVNHAAEESCHVME
jgi:seryl-tRNA synthetase